MEVKKRVGNNQDYMIMGIWCDAVMARRMSSEGR
jgi:hypothetical protein